MFDNVLHGCYNYIIEINKGKIVLRRVTKMFKEYIEKNITPLTIVKDLRNHKITDDEAIKQIEYCIYKALKEEAPMGKEELNKIKEYIAELLWDRYNMPARGNADCINEILKEGLKKLGQGGDFKKIPRKYYNQLSDILFIIT